MQVWFLTGYTDVFFFSYLQQVINVFLFMNILVAYVASGVFGQFICLCQCPYIYNH